MAQQIAQVAITVRDYDEAIAFYVQKLGFALVEDTDLFLETDDLQRDHRLLVERGVTVVRGPSEEPFGTVAVFQDLYGNLFDLIQPRDAPRLP